MGNNILTPIAFVLFLMAGFMKPKRTDVGYKRFLYLHFVTFLLLGETALMVSHLRAGTGAGNFGAGFAIFRFAYWCLLFWLNMKFRESAAKVRKKFAYEGRIECLELTKTNAATSSRTI